MSNCGLYVHIPFCRSKCVYCGFYSEKVLGRDVGSLISALIGEMGRYDLGGRIRTVYIGGGSPSCIEHGELLRLIEAIGNICGTVDEFTIEVNPGHVSREMLGSLVGAGVDRLSIGAQSFSQVELDFLGRGYEVSDIEGAVDLGRSAGFSNISLDLIFAVPGSSLDSWRMSLGRAIELEVEHISAYSLTYEEGTALHRMVSAGEIERISERMDRAMYEEAIDELGSAGIEQYEISNFARAGYACLHNLGYWANRPFVGIGPGAGSYWQGRRTMNIADIDGYVDAISCGRNVFLESHEPSDKDIACETAVLNLRRIRGIDLDEFRSVTGFDAMKIFGEVINRYKQQGLIGVTGGRVFLTREALGIADSVLCDFACF